MTFFFLMRQLHYPGPQERGWLFHPRVTRLVREGSGMEQIEVEWNEGKWSIVEWSGVEGSKVELS